MSRRNIAFDAALAALVLALSVGVLASGGLGTPDPDRRELDGVAIALVVLSALPLAARRRAPLTVYVVTSAATLALFGLDYPLDFPFGPLVAVYGLADAFGGGQRSARRRGAVGAAAAFVPAAAAAYALSGEDVAAILPGLVTTALILAGVWIAGDRDRLRRARIAELDERAERLERESERERRLAVAEERTRIARELHDSAGHAINAILVQAGAARLLYERDPEASRRSIAAIEEVARDTIADIDRHVRALRDDEALAPWAPADPDALEELVERHRAAGLTVATAVRGPRRRVPRSVAWAAYRVLQEALTNASRHGRGRADVVVAFEANAVEITVTNPTAPEPSGWSQATGGHGIVGMRERATLLGGALETERFDGIFRLHARLPYGDSPT